MKGSPILQISHKFPKNSNEFEKTMDDITCGEPDIEYIAQIKTSGKNKKLLKFYHYIINIILDISPSGIYSGASWIFKACTSKYCDFSRTVIYESKVHFSLGPQSILNYRSVLGF